MPITIQGARVEDITLTLEKESGDFKISQSNYSLIGSTGKVLAKQTIYGGIFLEPSPQTLKLMREFINSYSEDIRVTLGLDE